MHRIRALSRDRRQLRAFYQRIEERSGQKKVAIIAVMRRLLVIAWAIYRSRTQWDISLASPQRREAA